MAEIKVIPPLSEDTRKKIDESDPNPPVAICGECGARIFKTTEKCVSENKYCPVYRDK